jgi:penicillin-binding protein 2
MLRPDDREQRKTFGRRAMVLGGIQAAAMGALATRMYQLQVVDSETYATQAEENRINTRLLIPPRGRIVDRFGEPLAVNREEFRAYFVAERTRNPEFVLRRLAEIVPLGEEDIERVLREVRRRRRFVPVPIVGGLGWDQVAQVEANAPDLPGIFIEAADTRAYPAGPATAHIVGYVGPPNTDDQAVDGDPLLELPEFRIGKQGIERQYERSMRGTTGYSQVEINAGGRVLRELGRREGGAGADLVLTIDLELQRMALGQLAQHESATAVVMDVHNGDLLCLASSPSYDPNPFTNGIPAENWRKLLDNPLNPLINKTIAGQFAPGSTFKMVTALAALEAGTLTPETAVVCPGHLTIGNHTLHCWSRGGHGAMRLREAIKSSCDVYFYQAAMNLGIERFAAFARRLGIGVATGIDLPGEKAGLMPDTAWKRATFKDRVHAGEVAMAGIGQGYVLTTPLQLAVMTARLVNGGHAVTPRLLKSPRPADPAAGPRRAFASIGAKDRHLDLIRDAMDAVVNEPGGTALRSRIEDPTMAIGGKTGTSQVRRITPAERARGVIRNEDLPWERRDHALFVCYGPVKSPRYACAVVVEHGGGGSAAAAPIARAIMLEVQRRRSGERDMTTEKTRPPAARATPEQGRRAAAGRENEE